MGSIQNEKIWKFSLHEVQNEEKNSYEHSMNDLEEGSSKKAKDVCWSAMTQSFISLKPANGKERTQKTITITKQLYLEVFPWR